jgi:hypothetical protein
MSSNQTQQLHSLLSATLQPDPNQRKHAEETLKQIESQPGFLSSLLQIATAGNDACSQSGKPLSWDF